MEDASDARRAEGVLFGLVDGELELAEAFCALAGGVEKGDADEDAQALPVEGADVEDVGLVLGFKGLDVPADDVTAARLNSVRRYR